MALKDELRGAWRGGDREEERVADIREKRNGNEGSKIFGEEGREAAYSPKTSPAGLRGLATLLPSIMPWRSTSMTC